MDTAVGNSGSYQSAALNLKAAGNLITLEDDKNLAEISQSNFNKLQLIILIIITHLTQNLPF